MDQTVTYTNVNQDGWAASKDKKYIVNCIDVTITIENVVVNGWEFTAVPEAVGNKVIFHGIDVDQNKIPEHLHNPSNICEHCNVNSSVRKNVYIIHNTETDQYKQVGKVCLKDFIGGTSSTNVAGAFQFFAELEVFIKECVDDCMYSGISSDGDFSLNFADALDRAIKLQKVRGFVSKKKAFENCILSNASMIVSWNDSIKAIKELENVVVSQNEIDVLMNWLNSEENVNNEFLSKAKIYADFGFVSERGVSFVACLPFCYQKEMEIKALEAAKGKSQYVGTIGNRETFSGMVERVIPIETAYGIKRITLIRDNNGNLIKAGEVGGSQVGEKVEFVAKVEEHKEYNGEKQTVVTRAKLKNRS
jgi:hypothetical protein